MGSNSEYRLEGVRTLFLHFQPLEILCGEKEHEMTDQMDDLQRRLEETRLRQAEAEAAEEAKKAAVFEAQRIASQLLEQVNELAGQAHQLQQLIDAITNGLDTLKSAIGSQTGEFPLQKVMEDLISYRTAHLAYAQMYEGLSNALQSAKQAHPGGNFRDVDFTFLLLKWPNPARNPQKLLAEWILAQTPPSAFGKATSILADVDAVAAVVSALLDNAGRAGFK
jgi:uncharacterized phage infection (PIP) family protein YhgE